jgi:hypothetical protein
MAGQAQAPALSRFPEKLAGQARLADARLPADESDVAMAGQHLIQKPSQLGCFRLAADKRRPFGPLTGSADHGRRRGRVPGPFAHRLEFHAQLAHGLDPVARRFGEHPLEDPI